MSSLPTDSTEEKQSVPEQSLQAKLRRIVSGKWFPLLLVFLLLYGALNVGVYLCATKGFGGKLMQFLHPYGTPALTPTPTPTPRPIPHGPTDFTTSQSDKTVPQLREGLIDPYDPAKGATQTVTIRVIHTQPVTKVTAVLKTDHAVAAPVPFALISGTATDGKWQGSWQITDTYLYTYVLELEATSGTKTGSTVITLR
jgi:cytoskeletal protein RodZ